MKFFKNFYYKNEKLINNKGNYNSHVIPFFFNNKKMYIEYINSLDIIKKTNKTILYNYITKKFINYNKIIKKIYNKNDIIIIIYNSKNINNDLFYECLNTIKRNKTYIINTEQTSIFQVFENIKKLNQYIINKNNIYLCDYSFANINTLANNNIQSKLLEYQFNQDEICNLEKNIDIVTISFKNSSSKKRNCINLSLKNNFKNYLDIKGWGIKRDRLLFRSKILINIHYNSSYEIFEEIRCNRCIFNKIIVISEYSKDWKKFKYRHNMIFTDYDNIINKTKEVLNNYNYYYSLLFKNLKL